MNACLYNLANLTLWAQRNAFRDMGGGFRDKREHFDPSDLIIWVVALIGVFATLAVLARIIARREQRQVYNSPRALFRTLCATHDLERRDRWALRKLARHYKLEQPAMVFVEAELLAKAQVDPKFSGDRERLAKLAQRLFAAPADDAQRAAEANAMSELRRAVDSVHLAANNSPNATNTDGNKAPTATQAQQKPMVLVPTMPSSFAVDIAQHG